LEEMTVISPVALIDLSPDRSSITFSMLATIEDNNVAMIHVFEIETRKLSQVRDR